MVYQYKNNGYNIIMDVASGCIHVTDDIVYDIIAALQEYPDEVKPVSYDEASAFLTGKMPGYPEGDIREAYEEVAYLIEQQQLFTVDDYQEILPAARQDGVVKALCLHVAHDCNLACEYCFAGKGEYHGQRQLMSAEVGKKALDFLVRQSKGRRNLEVDFFGGEPLLNFDVVKELVAYGRSLEEKYDKNFRFTLTTNGLLLNDEILDFANREMSNLVLSIDGRKEVHDRMRPRRGGQGSYDEILPKLKKAADSRGQTNYYVRGTYTHYNTDFAADVMHLADLGFEQISVEPVVAPKEEGYALTEEDVPVLLEQYDILAKYLLERKKKGDRKSTRLNSVT